MIGISLPIRTLIALVLAVLVLAVLTSIFLLGLRMSPLDAQRVFAAGCVLHCKEISDQATATGQPLGIAAVERGNALQGSPFIAACNFLYPETTGYPYLCWLRDCCRFELPPP